MMRDVFRVFKKRADEQGGEAVRLSTEQFGLLYAITLKEEEVIQKDMAEIVGKDKSVILRLIDSLEEKELLRRVVDPKDRRKNYLMITKAGERVVQEHLKIFYALVEEVQQGLSQSDIDTFRKVVGHLKGNLEKL